MIRVLHVLGGLGSGGAEALIMNWYRNIDRTKVQFDFLVRSNDSNYVDEIEKLGGRIFYTARFPKHLLRNYKETNEVFQRKEWAVIHIHGNAAIYMLPLRLASESFKSGAILSMIRLLVVILFMCFFASYAKRAYGRKTFAYCAVVCIYTVFVGLRTGYNDTAAYIRSFSLAEPLSVFLTLSDRMSIMHNPLFYGIFAWARGLTENYHIVFLIFAAFSAVLLIRFIYYHTYSSFSYAILLFWGFGTGMFGVAAMKQITAMAILTLAYEAAIAFSAIVSLRLFFSVHR